MRLSKSWGSREDRARLISACLQCNWGLYLKRLSASCAWRNIYCSCPCRRLISHTCRNRCRRVSNAWITSGHISDSPRGDSLRHHWISYHLIDSYRSDRKRWSTASNINCENIVCCQKGVADMSCYGVRTCLTWWSWKPCYFICACWIRSKRR